MMSDASVYFRSKFTKREERDVLTILVLPFGYCTVIGTSIEFGIPSHFATQK